MLILCKVTILLIIILITYQDFSKREISVFLLVVLQIMLTIEAILINNLWDYVRFLFTNSIIICLLIVNLYVYYSIKLKTFLPLLGNYIGSGDILLLLVFCSGFSPRNLIIFILATLIYILLIALVTILRKKTEKSIPLAGYLGLTYLILSILSLTMNINIFYQEEVFSFLH
jgi:hypothetical protein